MQDGPSVCPSIVTCFQVFKKNVQNLTNQRKWNQKTSTVRSTSIATLGPLFSSFKQQLQGLLQNLPPSILNEITSRVVHGVVEPTTDYDIPTDLSPPVLWHKHPSYKDSLMMRWPRREGGRVIKDYRGSEDQEPRRKSIRKLDRRICMDVGLVLR
jgi:hypothetical protein